MTPSEIKYQETNRHYRCVCGTTFHIVAGASQPCPKCGRHYDSNVFASGWADTMTFDDLTANVVPVEPTQPDDLLGTTWGHFHIVARLGEGGMGSVYQAVDESLQRYVALKIIRRPRAAASDLADQLIREARAQARVSHPNVVHIYFVGQSGESPYFAMELVPGPTLADRLKNGPLPFAEVIRIGIQVVSALDHAARFDIVHGDVKPSNILEFNQQTVKLSDFGLSRRMSASDAADRVAGTPNYLAPETVRGEARDARSDIYSLGVTLFELTFGKLPYELSGGSLRERLEGHLSLAPSFPEPWPDAVPEAWRAVLQRMLAKNPLDRYQNYAELRRDLVGLAPRQCIRAARPARVIAWMIDAAVLTILQVLAMGPAWVLNNLDPENISRTWVWFASVAGTTVSGLLLLGTAAVQARWGETPGKKFFRLTIVDAHGVRPDPRTLALRVPLQFPWLAFFFSPLLLVSGLDFVDNIFTVLTLLLMLANGAIVLFRRNPLAIHDRLLRTQVVVDQRDLSTLPGTE